MSTASTIILTTGQPGSGKSYSRVHWLVTDYLINDVGIFITNLPLNVDLISADLSKSTGKCEDFFRSRLVVIPMDELKLWENLQNEPKEELKRMREERQFLPFEYFKRYDLKNAHIAIDEFHLYFSVSSPLALRQLWNDFFAEIRKLGCTFEAITQDLSLIPKDFIGKVGTRYDHLPFGNTRDPFFGILMSDWYELRSGFTGIVEQKISCIEYVKGTSFTGGVKWNKNSSSRFVLSPDFWKYYNSFQRNDTGESGGRITPAQRYGKKIWLWFLRRNFFKILGRFLLSIGVCWLLFGGGFVKIIDSFLKMTQTFSNSNRTTSSKKIISSLSADSKDIPNSLPVVDGASSNLARENKNEVLPSPDLYYKPAMFFDGSVWLRNGQKIVEKFEFTEGPYNGKKVIEINASERFYRLSDGFVVWMF